jgi:hypothetical protein
VLYHHKERLPQHDVTRHSASELSHSHIIDAALRSETESLEGLGGQSRKGHAVQRSRGRLSFLKKRTRVNGRFSREAAVRRHRKGRGTGPELFGSLSRAVTRSKLFSVTCPRFALAETCRYPLVLASRVNPGVQPGAGTSLADLDNSRCCSRIGCYGISEHTFRPWDYSCERFS